MQAALLFAVRVCELEARLWLEHRIAEGLRENFIKMSAARREVVHYSLAVRTTTRVLLK